jgi:hypothetical protein
MILPGRVTYQMFASYWPTATFGDQAPKLDLELQEARPFHRGEVALKYTRTSR